MRVIAYRRVSTEEQSRSGLGLAAQREAIIARAATTGWEMEWVEDEGLSAKSLDRPGLTYALAELKAGRADAIVAAKLDRISRSVWDFSNLLRLSRKQRWGIIVLDFDLDTTTAAGRMFANIMASFAEFERELIGERTKAALAEARASGVRLGREVEIPAEVESQVREMWERGYSLAKIAARLTEQGVPTARGGQWQGSTIRRVIDRMEVTQ